ncbi:MAG: DNA cytosine methyltransferase [Candidatus Peregrinibacteria bacterium]|nr:DNA cytosine methyltransferase [Candidatus Peregrinibacteria bacterium]
MPLRPTFYKTNGILHDKDIKNAIVKKKLVFPIQDEWKTNDHLVILKLHFKLDNYTDLVLLIDVIDLFCGCGGFSHGFQQAGFHIKHTIEQVGNAVPPLAEAILKC